MSVLARSSVCVCVCVFFSIALYYIIAYMLYILYAYIYYIYIMYTAAAAAAANRLSSSVQTPTRSWPTEKNIHGHRLQNNIIIYYINIYNNIYKSILYGIIIIHVLLIIIILHTRIPILWSKIRTKIIPIRIYT